MASVDFTIKSSYHSYLFSVSHKKVDPYLRPVYDALYQIIWEKDQTTRLMEREIIEIAPLAYMRGRTLDDAVIWMKRKNTTACMQMKMFLIDVWFIQKRCQW